MDGCGRTASGTAVESNAGAVAEQLLAYAKDGLYADNAGAMAGEAASENTIAPLHPAGDGLRQ